MNEARADVGVKRQEGRAWEEKAGWDRRAGCEQGVGGEVGDLVMCQEVSSSALPWRGL